MLIFGSDVVSFVDLLLSFFCAVCVCYQRPTKHRSTNINSKMGSLPFPSKITYLSVFSSDNHIKRTLFVSPFQSHYKNNLWLFSDLPPWLRLGQVYFQNYFGKVYERLWLKDDPIGLFYGVETSENPAFITANLYRLLFAG